MSEVGIAVFDPLTHSAPADMIRGFPSLFCWEQVRRPLALGPTADIGERGGAKQLVATVNSEDYLTMPAINPSVVTVKYQSSDNIQRR